MISRDAIQARRDALQAQFDQAKAQYEQLDRYLCLLAGGIAELGALVEEQEEEQEEE